MQGAQFEPSTWVDYAPSQKTGRGWIFAISDCNSPILAITNPAKDRIIHGTTLPSLAYHLTLTGKPSCRGGRSLNMITWEVDDVLRELRYRIKCWSNGLCEMRQGAGGLCGG